MEPTTTEFSQTPISYKDLLHRLQNNPFATEFSIQKKNQFYSWVNKNQQTIKDKYNEVTGGTPPAIFVPVIHGSVARGNANQENNSDTDGSIFYSAKNSVGPIRKMEETYPDKDWGVRFVNVQNIIKLIERFDPDTPRSYYQEYQSLAMHIAPIFGASSNEYETEKTLDSWRKEILLKLSSIPNLDINFVWSEVQTKWNSFFVNYSKRPDEEDNTIKSAIKERLGITEDDKKLEHGLKIANKIRSSTKLPSFSEMEAYYGVNTTKL